MDTINLFEESLAASGTEAATHKGFPNAAANRNHKPLSLDKLLVAHPASTYLFRVRGHDWEPVGIFDGDIAIVDRSLKPQAQSTIIGWDETGTFHIGTWSPDSTGANWGVITTTIHQLRHTNW